MSFGAAVGLKRSPSSAPADPPRAAIEGGRPRPPSRRGGLDPLLADLVASAPVAPALPAEPEAAPGPAASLPVAPFAAAPRRAFPWARVASVLGLVVLGSVAVLGFRGVGARWAGPSTRRPDGGPTLVTRESSFQAFAAGLGDAGDGVLV